jgi:RHS repeat-associated protein
VGGLLAMTVHQGANAGTYFYCFDGNGNVVALVDTNGVKVAEYEYDPFLRVLRATGPLAQVNPFLGSTKFYDWETGFYYYWYRYYDPETGRWPNRDPIGEQAGGNLYGFIRNNPIVFADCLGLLAAGDVIETGDYGDVKIIRQPTPSERDMASKAVCVVSRLINLYLPPQWQILWLTDMGIEGLNYRAGVFSKDRTEYVFISQTMVPKAEWQQNSMLAYGIVLEHEFDHYWNDTDDTQPGARPKATDTGVRINERAWEAARRAIDTKIACDFCVVAGFWSIRNQLEKLFCECGVDLGETPGRNRLK